MALSLPLRFSLRYNAQARRDARDANSRGRVARALHAESFHASSSTTTAIKVLCYEIPLDEAHLRKIVLLSDYAAHVVARHHAIKLWRPGSCRLLWIARVAYFWTIVCRTPSCSSAPSTMAPLLSQFHDAKFPLHTHATCDCCKQMRRCAGPDEGPMTLARCKECQIARYCVSTLTYHRRPWLISHDTSRRSVRLKRGKVATNSSARRTFNANVETQRSLKVTHKRGEN